MIRRIVCVFCAILFLLPCVSAYAVAGRSLAKSCSFDFDLRFSLNADSFPPVLRSRVQGYAELLNRLGLRGNIAWSTKNESMDLNASFYYLDKPSMSFPFRLYGVAPRLFLTSPVIGNETMFLNMAAFPEFAVKAKANLNIDLPYVAFLYPYSTEYAFSGLVKAWDEIIGHYTENTQVTPEQFEALSARWSNELQDNQYLQIWINALADGSQSPAAIHSEFSALPRYIQTVTGGKPVSVSFTKRTQTWKNAVGDILFQERKKGKEYSVSLSLPATEGGYVPSFFYSSVRENRLLSFRLDASLLRNPDAVTAPASQSDSVISSPEEKSSEPEEDNPYAGSEADEDNPYGGSDADDENPYGSSEYEEDPYGGYSDDYDDYSDEDEAYQDEDEGGAHAVRDSAYDPDYDSVEEDIDRPDTLLKCSVSAEQLPLFLPCDSSFRVTASLEGAAYPNYSFVLRGETKEDGSVSLSICKPDGGSEPAVEIFSCSGRLDLVEKRTVPNYMNQPFQQFYGVFSSNEQTISDFSARVIPSLLNSVFDFIAEAPTSACQSFLDDLTEMGVLDMLLK